MNGYIPWEIVIKKLKCEISPGEQQELDCWLKDEKHSAAYQELESLWNTILKEGLTYESRADEIWKKVENRIQETAGRMVQFSRRKFRWMAIAASFVFVVMLSFTGYVAKQWYNANTIEQTYISMGGKSKIVLPDGSSVWLNKESGIKYTSSAWSRVRSVELDGEALFEVTKDVSRPFVVKNGKFEIIVHGTTFNVSAQEGDDKMNVSLLEGAVTVKSGNEIKNIVPGEEAVCLKNTGSITVNKSDVNFAAMWAQQTIHFERKSIKELSKYLSKWYGVKIILDPRIPETQAYTFSIRHEPLEEILRLMARTNPIVYSFDEENVVKINKK